MRKVLRGVHQYREKTDEGDGKHPCCGKLNSLLQVQTLGVEAHALLRHKNRPAVEGIQIGKNNNSVINLHTEPSNT